ncbi:uncharacterized protein LOC109816431 [Cajanus cajan]|uniref:Uncharacterized protein n=1 Tax=Cajanus cajan TaxID=3821 RepID=A0A151RRF6_CAJCA|nr:uncharacterized protein LOC109816431 [Cajanus cajan]KYP45121.1 hypothetical protein KK1_033325 [Cajanus cajan]
MGIGNSKLNAAEGEVVPPKIRPMLVFKYEDFKKRTNAETNLSKKKLLKEATEEDDNSLEIQPSEEEKVSRVVPMANSECPILKDNHPLDQHNMNHAVLSAEAMEDAKGDDHDDNDHNDNNDDGRNICPGSPSFRIYCIDNEECDNYPTKTVVMHQRSHSADSVERVASTEVLPEVETESISTPKRKGNKKKFGAMRTLLKVKSCYHPIRNCTGNDRGLIVAAKTAKS